jgi:hypothetical protein
MYNQLFIKSPHTPVPTHVCQITGNTYATYEQAATAQQLLMFALNCTVPGDDSTHSRVTRTLAQWQALFAERQ